MCPDSARGIDELGEALRQVGPLPCFLAVHHRLTRVGESHRLENVCRDGPGVRDGRPCGEQSSIVDKRLTITMTAKPRRTGAQSSHIGQ